MATKPDSCPFEIGLFDGCFPHLCSMSLMSDEFECPKYIKWIRNQYLPITFFTDTSLSLAIKSPNDIVKIALLIEAPPFRTAHYDYAKQHQDLFDYILTPCLDLVDNVKWLWYPRSGSRIPLECWNIHQKTKLVSFVSSNKRGATGHEMRHEVFKHLDYKVDVFGGIVNKPVDKINSIIDYQYNIVIPAERGNGLFSDHIIDPISVGTVPIYWRRYNIGDYFDLDGILTFETISELEQILTSISETDYQNRIPSLKKNLELARRYRCVEDWIWKEYPFLFEV